MIRVMFYGTSAFAVPILERLAEDLRSQHWTQPATLVETTRYGRKYEIRAILKGPSGRASEVVSVWIIRAGEEVPRFVTAYPGGRR